jgi:hypothetical protein
MGPGIVKRIASFPKAPNPGKALSMFSFNCIILNAQNFATAKRRDSAPEIRALSDA